MISSQQYDIYYRQALNNDKSLAKEALEYAVENGHEKDAIALVYVLFGPGGSGTGSNTQIDAELARLVRENLFEDMEEVRRMFSILTGELVIITWVDPGTGEMEFDVFSKSPPNVQAEYRKSYGSQYFDDMLEIPSFSPSGDEEDTPLARRNKGIPTGDKVLIGGLVGAAVLFAYLAFKGGGEEKGAKR